MSNTLTDYSLVSGAPLMLNGGTTTLEGSATLYGTVDGPGTLLLAEGANALLNGFVTEDGAVFQIDGSVNQDGSVDFGHTSTDTAQVTISATGTYDLRTNDWLNNPNINDDGDATITNQGLLEKTVGTATSAIWTDIDNTGSIVVATGTLSLEGIDTSTLAGSVTGPGVLTLGRGSYLIDTTVLSVPTLNIDATETLQESLTYAGVASQTSGTVDLNTFNLTFNDSATIDSTIEGPGTLTIAQGANGTIDNLVTEVGTAVEIDGSIDQDGSVDFGHTSTDTAQVTISATGTYDLTTNDWLNNPNINDDGDATITNQGLLEKTVGTATSAIWTDIDNTGSIVVATGTLSLEGIDTSTLAGSVTGPGVLTLGRGSYLIDTKALSVATLDLYATETLDESLTYSGVFNDNAGTIDLNGYTLTLSGASSLGNVVVEGPGTLIVASAGSATLSSGFTVDGGATFQIAGSATQSGYVQYGNASTDSIQVTVEAGGTYDLSSGSQINNSNTNDDGTATITNAGLLENSNTASTTSIYATVANTGSIAVEDGALDLESIGTSTLDGVVTGSGTLILGRNSYTIDATTLNVQTLDFSATETLGESLTYNGTLNENAGTLALNGDTLTLGGTSSLANSALDGGGTLLFASSAVATMQSFAIGAGATAENAGGLTLGNTITLDDPAGTETSELLNDATGTITLASGATVTSSGTAALIDNAGLIQTGSTSGNASMYAPVDNTGTIGTTGEGIGLFGGGQIGGALTGTGEIDLRGGGSYTLEPNVALSIPELGVLDGGTNVTLAGNVTYGGTVNESVAYSNNTISLAGNTLDLTNTGTFDGNSGSVIIDGGGSLLLGSSSNFVMEGVAIDDGVTLENAGSLTLTSYYGFLITGGATLEDAGSVTQNANVAVATAGSADVGGIKIDGGATYTIDSDGFIYSSGTATITNDGTLEKTTTGGNTNIEAGVVNQKLISVSDGTIEFTGALTNDGTINVEGNVVNLGINTTVTAQANSTGTFEIGTNGYVNVSGSVDATQTFDFTGTDGIVGIGSPGPGEFDGTLDNFGTTDEINLYYVGSSAALVATLVNDDQIQVYSENNPSVVTDYALSGNYAGLYAHAVPEAGQGWLIEVNNNPCYLRGTLILTDRGEVSVEDLQVGDRLVTLSGEARPLRWIGTRSYAGRFAARSRNVMPILFRAGSLADGLPRRDLYVSPLHAMYLDNVLIQASALVNGSSIVEVERMETIEYYHLELETHDVIFAEGAASESFVDDDSRAMFHNAATFARMYPEATPAPAVYCAPRISEGYAVEAARHRLAVRAGVRGERRATPLRGFVDCVEHGLVEGWAQNPENPEAPVCVEVLVDGVVVAQALASRRRDDLARAGIGSGLHSFSVALPASRRGGAIEVRRASDGAPLALHRARAEAA